MLPHSFNLFRSTLRPSDIAFPFLLYLSLCRLILTFLRGILLLMVKSSSLSLGDCLRALLLPLRSLILLSLSVTLLLCLRSPSQSAWYADPEQSLAPGCVPWKEDADSR